MALESGLVDHLPVSLITAAFDPIRLQCPHPPLRVPLKIMGSMAREEAVSMVVTPGRPWPNPEFEAC